MQCKVRDTVNNKHDNAGMKCIAREQIGKRNVIGCSSSTLMYADAIGKRVRVQGMGEYDVFSREQVAEVRYTHKR